MNQKELMGKKVVVSKQLLKCKTNSKVYHQAREIPLQDGWVTGFRNLPFGDLIRYWDNEENDFKQRGITPCILVALGPRQNPIRVPLDGFEVKSEQESLY